MYSILQIANTSKNIGTNMQIKAYMKPYSREITSMRMRRLRHPKFYQNKPVEDLARITFPINFKRAPDEKRVDLSLPPSILLHLNLPDDRYTTYNVRETTAQLDYLFPKSKHYYMLRLTPLHFEFAGTVEVEYRTNVTFLP
jgi:hypothetical protein